MRLVPKVTRTRLLVVVLLVAFAAGAAVLTVRGVLRGSLPTLDGERKVAGLAGPVRIERDGVGVPTIHAGSRPDLLFGLGFLHAQERFFQMDLLRRRAAGELADLLGEEVAKFDRDARRHRFRARAAQVVAAMTPDDRAWLDAYVCGVNEGLAALANKPFEYYLLRSDPQPWRAEDSVLTALSMYLGLQSDNPEREATVATIHDTLPPAVAAWLSAPGGEWDAPLEGEPFTLPPVPGPDAYDLRAQLGGPLRTVPVDDTKLEAFDHGVAGSNNWAVAGSHTAHGGAILANDMHLTIMVPNTWYRACLVWPGADGRERRAVGVTLPGGPALVAGSNGAVAWGFTNTQADWSDLVILETDPDDPHRYRTPEGVRPFETFAETIKVRGKPDEVLAVRETVWGPVFDNDSNGRLRALRWTAHDPECVNFTLADLMTADTLEQALDVGNRAGGPHQNLLVADAKGDIAWTILGRMPRRVGFDGRLPRSWADGRCRWDGYRPPGEAPRIVRPKGGRLWTANNRTVGGEALAKLGFGGYDRGARAGRIRDELLKVDKATEADMLRIQLDDRVTLLDRWHKLLVDLLRPAAVADHPARAQFRDGLNGWTGRGEADSVAFRLVVEFRMRVLKAVLGSVTTACRQADPKFLTHRLPQLEGPTWQLVSQRPLHWLDPRYATWDEFLLAEVDATLEDLLKDRRPLAEHTWGDRNRARIQHPIGRAVPFLGRWLDMPADPLPGAWADAPRMQHPEYGASERFAVSPGKEDQAYFHMPCGQSGHPLSPHYRDGHAAWLHGERTPLLPGPTVHVLTLRPGS
jgi:penicillin amidase